MKTLNPCVAEIRARGQITIPKKIREEGQFEEGQVVSIIPVGDNLIITPKRLELGETRREIKKILKRSGLSVEDLIAALDEEREALYREKYGKKGR